MTQSRDSAIIALIERGARYTTMGLQFSISPERARQIFKRHELMTEERHKDLLRGWGLSARAVNTMRKLTGTRAPVMADLANWLAQHPSDWKQCLLRISYCGRKTAAEISDFAAAHGLVKPEANIG